MKKSITFKITIFMVITFILSILLAIFQESLNIDYQYVTLPQWGPGIAAIILSYTIYKNLQPKIFVMEKHSFLSPFLFLAIPFILMGVSYFTSSTLNLIPKNVFQINFKILVIVLSASLFGAVGEALGWRSFLQLSVDKRFNYFKSAVIVGLLWGLWHVGNYSNGPIYMALFLVFTISASLILSILIRRYKYNFFLAAMFHLGINLGFYIFFRAYLNDLNMMLVNAIVWLAVSIAMMYFLRNRIDKSVNI